LSKLIGASAELSIGHGRDFGLQLVDEVDNLVVTLQKPIVAAAEDFRENFGNADGHGAPSRCSILDLRFAIEWNRKRATGAQTIIGWELERGGRKAELEGREIAADAACGFVDQLRKRLNRFQRPNRLHTNRRDGSPKAARQSSRKPFRKPA
jgi:hypothetical protein